MDVTHDSTDYLNTHATGYMVNTLLSHETGQEITDIQNRLIRTLPGALWPTPQNALHVTLLDWLAPLIEYDKDKDVLFDQLFGEYDAAMNNALAGVGPIEVHFDKLLVSPAAIALVADDSSANVFNGIRNAFLDRAGLLPSTKQPPNIVHSTIARFVSAVPLNDVRAETELTDISIHETIQEFQLVRETTLPMLNYSVMKKYPLGTA